MLLDLPRHIAALRAAQVLTDGGERRAVLVIALTSDAPDVIDGLRFHTATDRQVFAVTPLADTPQELPAAEVPPVMAADLPADGVERTVTLAPEPDPAPLADEPA